MKNNFYKRTFKYVYALLEKYGRLIWNEAKYILKKAIKKLLRKSACTIIESVIIRFAIEPLMKYGLRKCKEGGLSRDDFLEGLVS